MANERVLLWVDDERHPKLFLTKDQYTSYSVVLDSLSYDSAMEFLDGFRDRITHIHLDNDLGDSKEGRDIFNTIEAMVFFKELPVLEEIIIHTSNPAAADSMMSAKHFLADMGVKLKREYY